MKRRRSLTHVGGAVERWGDATVAAALAGALDVAPAAEPRGARAGSPASDEPDRAHVHGFHAYPARMHPATAARLVAALSAPGETVLDPFCGSGTVLVEALLAGRRAIGTDLNPLAVRLATLKTTRYDAPARAALVAGARAAATLADDRRERRAGATRRYGPDDMAAFDAHVLLELDSLRAGIAAAESGREALELVLSSILVKVSRRASDTASHDSTRRIAAGYPARLLVKKTEELTRSLAELERLVPPGTPPVQVSVDDIARLRTVAPSTVDAVVTSPPYVATYDYLAHHAMRMRWLGLDPQALFAGEVGSRRRYGALDEAGARAAWTRELTTVLRSLARVCRRGARVGLVIADSAVGGEALRADAILASIAPGAGFALLARASQVRPHFHGPTARAFDQIPRAEHAIALEKL